MPSADLAVWRSHIIMGDSGQLAPGTDFIFIQPRPGIFERVTRELIHPDVASLGYPPESLLYARWIKQGHQERCDLPDFYTETVYRSFTKAQERNILKFTERLGGPLDKVVALFVALAKSEAVGPYPEAEQGWVMRKGLLLLLPEQDPSPNDGINFFTVVDGIYLPPQFYNPSDTPTAQKWAIYQLLRWCNLTHWVHEPSNTLLRGWYGIKWPILLLIILMVNMRWAGCETNPRPNWLPLSWTANEGQRGECEVDLRIAAMIDALAGSTEVLKRLLQYHQPKLESEGLSWISIFSPNSTDKFELVGPPEWANEWEHEGIVPRQESSDAEGTLAITMPTTGVAPEFEAEMTEGVKGKKRAADSDESPPKKETEVENVGRLKTRSAGECAS
ncbi:hypothetical protein FRC08_006203 [Ceratobasidium sp. 394]|nr:hypothetical protein FRC08_006203 [Ceratobasidium sp. 394]